MDPELGNVYTPPALAQQHALDALRVYDWATGHSDRRHAEIVDLACGDGALLQAACDLGVDSGRCWGYDLDPAAVEAAEARDPRLQVAPAQDALFSSEVDVGRWDIALMNPPWIGKVSHRLGSDYAKRVAKRFGPGYNAASDLSAAFVLRASEVANQISVIATNTIWQGRTYRSGIKRLLMSGEWAALWYHDPVARYNGLSVEPGSRKWPGEAKVHYITFHLVRVACERYSCFEGGMHHHHDLST
jgi:hypothetical protein